MRTLLLIGAAAISVSILGCDAEERTGENAGTTTEVTLPSRVLSSDELLGHVGAIAVVEDRLWIGDHSGDPYLHLLDRKTGQVLVSWGRQGEGPGDFKDVQSFFPSPSNPGHIRAYDATMDRVVELGVSSDLEPEVTRTWTFSSSPRPRRVTALGVGFVAWTEMEGGQWLFLDSNAVERSRTDARLLGGDSVPNWERAKASSAFSVCVRPGADQFAVLYGNAGRIEIYDADGSFEALAAVPSPSDGDFARREDGAPRWRRIRVHYVGCAATGTNLLGLYSGRVDSLYEGPRRQEIGDALSIHVFSWDGAYEGQLNLQAPIQQLTLTEEGDTLYGTSPTSSLIFEMPIGETLNRLRGGTP